MTDLATLIEIFGYTALVVAPAALLTRLLAGNDGPSLPVILGAPLDPPWPRGVQEEEPVRWQLDRLRGRSAVADPLAEDCRPVGRAYPRTAHPNRIG